MSDKEKISLKVHSLKRTRRAQLIADYAMRGLFWGALATALLFFAARLWVLPFNEYVIGGALAGAILLGFIAASLLVRLTPLRVANDIDVALGLRERVSSAVAFAAAGKADHPFERTVVKDAARTVHKLPLKRVYPWRVPPAWKLAVPALIIAGLLTFVPQLNWFVKESDRAEAKLVKSEGSKLIDVAKQLEDESEKLKDPVLKEQAEELKRVGEKLESGRIDNKEALKELKKLKDKLETQAQNQLPPGERQLSGELAQELLKNPSTRELGKLMEGGNAQEMMSKMESLLSNLEQGNMSAADQQMVQDFMKALDKTLKSEAASDPTAQNLKQAMENLKQSLEQEQQLRQQTQQALDDFEQDLNKLTSELSQQGMNQQAQQLQSQLQQMKQQMQQQGSISKQALQQMLQQLDSANEAVQSNQNLSAQEQQNLENMVQQAREHLEQQSGQPGELSQSNSQMQQNRQQMAQDMKKESDCASGG